MRIATPRVLLIDAPGNRQAPANRRKGEIVIAGRKASVSLSMIVRNEAHQLADCLEPVAALFDEIVIVDTGSHDETRQVAARFTPEVFEFNWSDDFSAARNESLRYCTGDWIFWLDADDRLAGGNVAKLRALLESLDDRPRGFLMDTICRSHDPCEGDFLVTHLRLYRRHPQIRWRGRVHEQLDPYPLALGYELNRSDIQIDHVGYLDATARQRKLQRNVRLLRMDYAVDPGDGSTLAHLGLAYARLGNHSEAKKCLLTLLAAQPGAADHLRPVYATLAEMALREGKPQEAIQVVGRGLACFPQDEHLLYVQAKALYELGKYDAAKSILAGIIASGQSPRYHAGAPSEIKRKLAPRNLGEVLRMQRALPAAEATLLGVVNDFPEDTLSWHALGRVYIDTNNHQKFHEIVERLRLCPRGDIFASLLLAAWHLLHNELEPAELVIEHLICTAPEMPLARLLRAEWLAASGAPPESRIAAYRDFLRLQPGNAYAAGILQRLQSAQRAASSGRADECCTSVVLGAAAPPEIASR
jgi:tetratricopeptide (TPR) repeat protein